MITFGQKLLSNKLLTIVHEINKTTLLGSQTHNLYIAAAFQQVINEGCIIFHHPNTKNILMQQLTSNMGMSGSFVARMLDGCDFDWLLFDRCEQLCEQYNLTDCSFFYRQITKPILPDLSNKQSLELLTVADIKQILKNNNHPTTGKRDDLVDLLWRVLPINDTEKLLNQRYQEKFVKYQQRHIANKYDLLLHHILHRAYFLRDISRNYNDKYDETFGRYSVKLFFVNGENNHDEQLAKLLDGTGYQGVIVNGKINKLMPLFPSDMASADIMFTPRHKLK